MGRGVIYKELSGSCHVGVGTNNEFIRIRYEYSQFAFAFAVLR